ncbi:hypothetical protein [uncultured Mycolicibacterium sp.]|uniref:hypothetical protein n=1 Tax=uncultured Mycolicibacterium sp. TaxID=2320817 RepID=UPI0032B1AA3C
MPTPETAPEAPHTNDTEPAEGIEPDDDSDATDGDTKPDDEPETYPASVVKDLRDKNAKYRTRARDAEARADSLAERLHAELVRADGRLADPADLPSNAEHLDDAEALTAAIDALLAERPHYAARKVTGSVGQGITGKSAAAPTWSNLFTANR